MKPNQQSRPILLFYVLLFYTGFITSSAALAKGYELIPFLGYSASNALSSDTSKTRVPVSNDASYGLAFAWQAGPNGQGMILVNVIDHTYQNDLDNNNHALDIIYSHFNGVAQFRQQNYVTTVSLGVGASYFKTDNNNGFYPSLTAAIGTRYEISPRFAIVTELRSYATLIGKNNNLFCQTGSCTAKFGGTTWLESNLSVGLAYKF